MLTNSTYCDNLFLRPNAAVHTINCIASSPWYYPPGSNATGEFVSLLTMNTTDGSVSYTGALPHGWVMSYASPLYDPVTDEVHVQAAQP